jgi:DNA-binding beta-propeller fold protein YncE
MNKPEFGNYNNILWNKLFKTVECDQITKYYADWTSNIDINNECIKAQKKIIHVETLFKIQFSNGIACKKDGSIIISDDSNNCIRIIKDTKNLKKYDCIGNSLSFNGPSGLAIRSNNDIIVADTLNHRICSINEQGIVKVIAGKGTKGCTDGKGSEAEFYCPMGIAIDSNDTIFVTDTSNNCIRAISKEGIVTTIAGSTEGRYGCIDGEGLEARFYMPYGIAVMKDQTIIIADLLNNKIRSIDKDYVVRTIAGSYQGHVDGNKTKSQFNCPYGVAIMEDQTIIITDKNNHCIRSIDKDYNVNTIAGSTPDYQDGLGYISKFNFPSNIAITPDNSIIIETNNNAYNIIRRLYYK